MKKQPTKRQIAIAEHFIKKETKRLMKENSWGHVYIVSFIENALLNADKKYDFKNHDDRVRFVKNEIVNGLKTVQSIVLPDETTFERASR